MAKCLRAPFGHVRPADVHIVSPNAIATAADGDGIAGPPSGNPAARTRPRNA